MYHSTLLSRAGLTFKALKKFFQLSWWVWNYRASVDLKRYAAIKYEKVFLLSHFYPIFSTDVLDGFWKGEYWKGASPKWPRPPSVGDGQNCTFTGVCKFLCSHWVKVPWVKFYMWRGIFVLFFMMCNAEILNHFPSNLYPLHGQTLNELPAAIQRWSLKQVPHFWCLIVCLEISPECCAVHQSNNPCLVPTEN